MRTTATALIIFATAIPACGVDDGGGAADAVEFVRPPEGVPLPDGSTAIDSGPNFAVYEAEGSTFDDLASFYRSEFPDGDTWHSWGWCEQRELPWGSQWTFERAGQLLIVDVVKEVDDEPATFSVGVGRRYDVPWTPNC